MRGILSAEMCPVILERVGIRVELSRRANLPVEEGGELIASTGFR